LIKSDHHLVKTKFTLTLVAIVANRSSISGNRIQNGPSSNRHGINQGNTLKHRPEQHSQSVEHSPPIGTQQCPSLGQQLIKIQKNENITTKLDGIAKLNSSKV